MVDVNKVLKETVKKGKVKLGKNQTKAAISKGQAKLVVVSKNCPYRTEIETLTKEKSIPVYQYKASGLELGYACGKNFSIAGFAIVEEGETSIMQLVKKRK
jgi:large subunit ribosomal protein L30e